MRTHVFTFILAALPLAMTAQAGEISMDAGAMPAGASAYTSSARGDCASARSLHADAVESTSGNGQGRHASGASGNSRMRVSDQVAEESSQETASGSSAAGTSLAVPVKSRSTRWQSLVPGAIK